jgi:Sec-independent protein translocase protein TatA
MCLYTNTPSEKSKVVMSIGIGQVLIILLLGILLFGNAPKIIKDLGKSVGAGILEVRKAMQPSAEARTSDEAEKETPSASVNQQKRQLTEHSTATEQLTERKKQ